MNVWVHPQYGERRDTLSQDWSRYLTSLWPSVGLLPIPNLPDAAEAWADGWSIDGLILSNGNDWGEAPERDQTEEALVAWCRKRGKPVLGVCRGLQALNVLLGGTLEADLQAATNEPHAGTRHAVTITDPVFQGLFGKELEVNSYHNQGVLPGGLASAVVPFASSATGGAIEGFYHPSEPLLAIQWHPERPNPAADADEKLLKLFFSRGAFWREREKETG